MEAQSQSGCLSRESLQGKKIVWQTPTQLPREQGTPRRWGPGNRGTPKEGQCLPTRLNTDQTAILLQAFEKNRLPGSATPKELARKTGLSEDQVQVWFQNCRGCHPGQQRSSQGPDSSSSSLGAPEPQVLPPFTWAKEASQDPLGVLVAPSQPVLAEEMPGPAPPGVGVWSGPFGANEQLAQEFGVLESPYPIPRGEAQQQQHAQQAETPTQLPKEQGTPWRQEPRNRGTPRERQRPRTRLNPDQIAILVQAFETNRLPGYATRKELARKTGLSEDRVHVWFANRRAHHREQQRSSRGPDITSSSPGALEPQVLPPLTLAKEASQDPLGVLVAPSQPGLAGEMPGPAPPGVGAESGPGGIPGDAWAGALRLEEELPGEQGSPCLLDELLKDAFFSQKAEAFLSSSGDHKQDAEQENEPEPPLSEEEFQTVLSWLESSFPLSH